MIYIEWNGCKSEKNPNKLFLGLKRQRGLRLNIKENKVSAADGNKLQFNKHLRTLCSKVNKEIGAFSRLDAFISREQALVIYNMTILSNFKHCPLI